MRALTVTPGQAGSVRLEDVPEPAARPGEVVVRTLAVGICGTDREIAAGEYGAPPPGEDRLILGHESLGEVVDAPPGSGLQPGDTVVGIVRRPDPVPCMACAAGEWDMCRNGRYTEHGIKERHGFAVERWVTDPPALVAVPAGLGAAGVLVEPTSVVAKAWEHIDRIGTRAAWVPERVLVTGAGPIGLLAALLGTQRGLEVHVLDLVTEGVKPKLVADLGAHYHHGDLESACDGADIVLECTGVGQLVFDAMRSTGPAGIVCLTGVSTGGRAVPVDVGALNRELVLENDVVFGSVNANRRHYEIATEALVAAAPDWLAALITRRVPLGRWREALRKDADDVKVVLDFGSA